MMVGFWVKLQEYKVDEVYQSSRAVIGKMTYLTLQDEKILGPEFSGYIVLHDMCNLREMELNQIIRQVKFEFSASKPLT